MESSRAVRANTDVQCGPRYYRETVQFGPLAANASDGSRGPAHFHLRSQQTTSTDELRGPAKQQHRRARNSVPELAALPGQLLLCGQGGERASPDGRRDARWIPKFAP